MRAILEANAVETKMTLDAAQVRYYDLVKRIEGREYVTKMPIELEELDRMADYSIPVEGEWVGIEIDLLQMDLADYDVHGFMEDLEWWRDFAFEFLVSADEHYDVAGLLAYREKLLALYGDALNGYVLALKMSMAHGEGAFIDGPSLNKGTFMALRAYRLFTREVCFVAQRIYPELDIAPLLQMD